MSQTDFLDNVVSWDERKCAEQLDEALPRLVICLEEAFAVEEQIGILKLICNSFLPCVKLHEAESRVYSRILPKTCECFDKVLSDITSGVKDHSNTHEITASLEMAVEVIDCIERCIQRQLSSQSQVELQHVHSLPGCTIHTLSGAYTHCKESGNLYKDLLSKVSESLSVFFRKAHSLQMVFLNMMEQTTVLEASEQDVQDLCKVCDGLYEICQIVTALDMKVVVSLWKAVSKLASQYKELLFGHLDVCRMVCHLCGEISSGYEYLFQLVPRCSDAGMSQGDEKAFSKSLRICGFQMKILVLLVKDFSAYLGQCEKELLSLMIAIQRMFPPSLSASKLDEKHQDQIKSQICIAVDPLITSLMSNRRFRQFVTRKDTESSSEDDSLPLLLLQINILEILPKLSGDDQDAWINPVVYPEDIPVHNIVQAILTTVGRCFVEMALPVFLPGVSVSGKQERDVCLYEYVCTHLCGFIGSLPVRHFGVLEEVLVSNCLSSCPYVSTLVTDCWCFLSRYGSADLCDQHVKVLLKVYNDVSVFPHSDLTTNRLISVLSRLIKFIAPQHQQSLVKEYPPSSHVGLWSELSLTSFSPSAVRDVLDELVPYCTKSLHNWINKSNKTMGQLHTVISSVRCQANIYSYPSLVEKFITPQQQSVTVEKVCQLWTIFSTDDWDSRPCLQILLARLFQLTSQLVAYLNTSNILQILTVTQKLLLQPSTVLLRLEIIQFLKNLGSAKLTPSSEQNQVLHKLALVFSETLRDRHCVVHHRALEGFTQYAEETVHESVVPECMESDSSLQEKVVMFLNKIPSGTEKIQFDTVLFLREQLQHQMSCSENETQLESEHREPVTKRARVESNDGDEGSNHHKTLQKFQGACSEVHELLKTSPAPAWFISSIQQTLEKLSTSLQ